MSVSFDNCEIDCDRRELHRNGIVVHLEPQVFDVLVHLVRPRYISELSEFFSWRSPSD